MRRAKVDGNHGQIKQAFEDLGFSARSTAMVSDDFPDLVVALGPVACLVEVKMPGKKLKPGQEAFRALWRGWTDVARGIDDVQRIAAQMRQIYRRAAS